jgi:hypothetical protein
VELAGRTDGDTINYKLRAPAWMESRVCALPHGNDDSKNVADTRCRGKRIGPIPLTRSTPPTVEFTLACQNATYMQWLIRQ